MADIKNHSTLPTSLVSYWDLEEASGTRYDLVGSNNLTDTNTVAGATGLVGEGASYTYANSEVLETASNLGITGGVCSVSMWVKLSTEITSGKWGFFSQGDAGTDVQFGIGYDYNGGTQRIYVNRQKQNTSNNPIYNTVTLGTSDWHHIVLTYDGSTLEGFYNGTSFGTLSTSGNGASSGVNHFNIGQDQTGFADYCTAYIDEVGVWNKAITADEVSDLYNSGSGLPYYDPADIKNDTDLTTNLISYWEMEQATAATATDSHGTNDLTNSSTGSGVTSATGILNQGADFEEGNDEYFYKSDPGSWDLDIGGDMSISGWFKLESLITGQHYVFMRDSGDPNRNWAFGFLESSGDNLTMYNSSAGTNATTTSLRSVPTGTLSTGVWYHLVWVYDASAGQMEAYVDGVSKGTVAGLNTSMYTGGTARFTFGQYSANPAAGLGYDGVIDETAIYDKALTVAEVRALYGYGTPPVYEAATSTQSENALAWCSF